MGFMNLPTSRWPKMKSYLTHLECTNCNQKFSANQVQTTCCACDKVLFARYDLEKVKQSWQKSDLLQRPHNIWRWFEIMPVLDPEHVVSLGEGGTPLLHAQALGGKHRAGQKKKKIKKENQGKKQKRTKKNRKRRKKTRKKKQR